MPKLKPNGHSRATSPLAGGGSRATSPVGSPTTVRADSPGQNSSNGPTSPSGVANGKTNNKRKAEDGAAPSKPKKRRAQATVTGELNEEVVIDWLRKAGNVSTRECIAYFTPYLTDESKKQGFTKLVKEVAALKNGRLVLKAVYRLPGDASPQSPSAVSPSAE